MRGRKTGGRVAKPDSHYVDRIHEMLESGMKRAEIRKALNCVPTKTLTRLLGPHTSDGAAHRKPNPVALQVILELKELIESQSSRQRGRRSSDRKHIAISYCALAAHHLSVSTKTVLRWVNFTHVPPVRRTQQIREWIDLQKSVISKNQHLIEPNTGPQTEESIRAVERLRAFFTDNLGNKRHCGETTRLIYSSTGMTLKHISAFLRGELHPRGQMLAKLNAWLDSVANAPIAPRLKRCSKTPQPGSVEIVARLMRCILIARNGGSGRGWPNIAGHTPDMISASVMCRAIGVSSSQYDSWRRGASYPVNNVLAALIPWVESAEAKIATQEFQEQSMLDRLQADAKSRKVNGRNKKTQSTVSVS
jgi:hypothetical protein